MKKLRIISIAFLLILSLFGLLSWRTFDHVNSKSFARPINVPVTMCGSFVMDWADTTIVQTRILSGLGDLNYRVSTSVPEAQAFFNQGLRLIYAFNHWEAIQSFRRAAQLDPECAMAYWGLALAYGPNLNDVNLKDRERMAYESVEKAMQASNASPLERDLINALSARYDGSAYDDRHLLNERYADAMRSLLKKYPGDQEVLTLTADAIMNTMPWDYYEEDGSAREETQGAKQILERAIRQFPAHPGAHHLYIHLLEASADAGQALPSAGFLEKAMPGAGHIVHMPAHIYIRVGQYARSIEVNQKAVEADENYLANSDNRGMYRWAYYPHNIDFISYSAYMEGRSKLATETAMKLAYKGNLLMTSNPSLAQHFAIEPMIAFARFGRWTDILSLQEPDKDLIYAQVMYRFVKGLSLIRTNKTQLASIQLVKLDSLGKLDTLRNIYGGLNPVSKIADVARNILRGELLMKQGKSEEGILYLTNAVKAEDSFRYNEPQDWKIPARHFLGAALLQSGKYDLAESVYLEDLRRCPENGWSLFGLQQSQSKLGRKSEAARTAKRFKRAWTNADVELTFSRF